MYFLYVYSLNYSISGWSWSDITLTPPQTAIHGDQATFEREKKKAKKNFLKMSTFKGSDTKVEGKDEETTSF
jgi:hypothetical protein